MTTAKVQKIVDYLEEAYLKDEVKLNLSKGSRFESIEPMIYALAERPRHLTLFEVFEEISKKSSLSYSDVRILDAFYKIWVDLEAVKNREDNVLNLPSDSSHWSIGYQKALAGYILRKGELVLPDKSFMEWRDYNLKSSEIGEPVAVFNITEDVWSEFSGTFVTSHDSYTGMIADVVYSSGVSRQLRVVGELGEIIREIT